MERHEPNDGPGPGATGAPPEPAAGEGERRVRGRHLGGGWRVIDGCRLTPNGPPVEIVLVHRALGLAIMELEPRWTPGAEELVQKRLTAAGFADRFPGHLPIIHRRLRREVLGELPTVLTEAFSWQDPLTIAAELDWIQGLREALGATDPQARTRGPGPEGAIEAQPAADRAGRKAAAETAAPSAPADPQPAIHAPPLAALAAAMGTSGATPAAANAPDRPAGAVAGPARGRRTGLVVGGAAIAAGIALAVVLSRQPVPAPETPGPETRVQMAVATGGAAPVLTQLAGATPARALPTTDAPPPPSPPATARLEPIAPFAEPDAPRLEAAEAVLAARLPPEPIAPFAEPEAPRLEAAEAVLAAQVPPEPIAPFAEPEAPRLEAAEAMLAAQVPPEPIAPFAEPDAPRLEAAEAVLAAQLRPEPIAPFAEPDAPRLEAAEAVLAAQLAPEPIAPFAEPDAPRLEAAEAVLAARLAPEPIAPFAEPEAPRLEAAEAVLAVQLAPEPIAPFAEPDPPQLDAAERALGAALAPPVAAPPPAAAPAAAPTAPRMAPEMIGTLLRRGNELLGIGDVSAARRFFERAAAGGSGEAALAAGATYDPRELQRIGARGIPPDREAALAWYRRAAAMGVAEVQDRIRALEASP